MSFADGVVNAIDRYKRGFYFSPDFVGDHSWNGFERNLLFESVGNRRFTDVARAVGVDEIKDSRAVAVADLNNDGRLDLAMQNNNETPTIYLNQSRERGNFLKLKLIGQGKVNRDAIGTRVEVAYVGKNKTLAHANRWVEAGNGYASQSPTQLHFGLGPCEKIVSIGVYWPDGSKNIIEQDSDELIDQSVTLMKTGSQIAMEIKGTTIQLASIKPTAGTKK